MSTWFGPVAHVLRIKKEELWNYVGQPGSLQPSQKGPPLQKISAWSLKNLALPTIDTPPPNNKPANSGQTRFLQTHSKTNARILGQPLTWPDLANQCIRYCFWRKESSPKLDMEADNDYFQKVASMWNSEGKSASSKARSKRLRKNPLPNYFTAPAADARSSRWRFVGLPCPEATSALTTKQPLGNVFPHILICFCDVFSVNWRQWCTPMAVVAPFNALLA